jgi:hypothetical protein
MSHFALVENGLVTKVIVANQDFIDTGVLGDPAAWVQTSYNTRGGVHYGQNGEPDGGTQIAYNYAGIDYNYDGVGFYAPQPYPSWILNKTTYLWEAPVPMPTEGGLYTWDEATLSWSQNVPT